MPDYETFQLLSMYVVLEYGGHIVFFFLAIALVIGSIGYLIGRKK